MDQVLEAIGKELARWRKIRGMRESGPCAMDWDREDSSWRLSQMESPYMRICVGAALMVPERSRKAVLSHLANKECCLGHIDDIIRLLERKYQERSETLFWDQA